LSGGDGNDTLTGGGTGEAVLYGGDGIDSINAISGDVAYGGEGNDSITFGAAQQANVYGGSGDDYINATGAGADANISYSYIYGDDGDDTIFSGDDDTGQLIVYGGAGNDLISGADGTNDILYGGDGADTIYAVGDGATTAGQNDTISGGAGADLLYGAQSADVIYGGEGNDTIFYGGDGVDDTAAPAVLYGGEGADEFTFSDDVFGQDYTDSTQGSMATVTFTTIADFTTGTDKISLYSLFASNLTPAFVNQDITLATTNDQISWVSDGTDTKVAVIGDANEYLYLNLSGVTTLALTDFEIL
jgi:Ca2+-binding RTX toxin-like protein